MDARLIKYIQTSHILAVVAREGSFSKAAEVLGVHQTAISHRVKSLEEVMGVQIFKRTTRKLTLTHVGQRLCGTARDCVLEMQKSYTHATQHKSDSSIRISTISSLAMKWFLAIMPDAKLQGIDLSLHVKDTLSDIEGGEADVALRFGLGSYPGLYSKKILKAVVQPVTSPKYIELNGINTSSIGNQKLDLLVDKVSEGQALFFRWTEYLKKINNNFLTTQNAIHMDRTDLALHAAINGMGVALGRSLLIEEDIANGFLVPIDRPIEIKSSYWIVCTHDFSRTQKFKNFEKWVIEKVAAQNCITPA